ncbi:Magnetosome protein MamB*, greigite-specific [Candidatus Magnetomoraceae bacterium gMMP-1]
MTDADIKEPTLDYPEIKETYLLDNEHLQRVCWIAFWANLGLAVFKIVVGCSEKTVGTLGYSQLLIIDGLNSAANSVIITIILFGMYMSNSKHIDSNYPFGKGKVQYIITLLVGALLVMGSGFIFVLSFKTFFIPRNIESIGLGLSTALISIIGNFMLIRFLMSAQDSYKNGELKKIIRIQSLNILSSTMVANALIMTGLLGWFLAERIGSLSVSAIVVGLSIRIIKTSLDGIMDRSGGKDFDAIIEDQIKFVDQVEELKWVRTRWAGQNLCVDLCVGIKGTCTIHECDQIHEKIHKLISKKLENISHVLHLEYTPV